MARVSFPRRPLAALLLALGSLAFASFHGAAPARAAQTDPKERPNVLFIAVDDLNDWVSFLDGYPGVKTPNLDRLAKRGVFFTRAYCPAPACNPSRAALLCGKRPSTSGVYHNNQPWRPVMPDVVTLPEHFRANSYHVVAGGKIFHDAFNDLKVWDTYFKAPGADPKPANTPLNGIQRAAHFDWGPVDAKDEDMRDWKTVQWAAEYLAQPKEKPFFLGVGLHKPHLPWYVPQKYFDMYPLAEIKLPKVTADDLNDVPEIARGIAKPQGDHRKVVEAGQWEKAVQAYLASITFADACLGKLLDAFDRSPHAKNTVIVLWGDHGWHLGEKMHWRKFALWEEATRMPFIVVDPRGGAKGARCERPVNLMDLYPTLIEMCRLSPRAVEGHSIAALVKNPKVEWSHPSVTTFGRDNHAVRSERWRYIRYSDGTEELYDHEKDPQEWTNVAGKAELASVKADLARHLPKVNAPDAPRRGNAPE